VDAFGKSNLPSEGVGYAKRLKADEPLSSEELRRFNRLLTEAAFPGEIRKLYGRGWRPVMIVYGLSGVIVAIGIWFVFRDRPELHSRVNDAEREVIEAGRLATAAAPTSKAGRLPIRPFLTSFSLWCNCANQVGTNIGWIFLVTWLSRYFIEMHSVPILERSLLVMMPNLIGLCGGFLGGRWVDWLLPRIGLKWSRSLPPIITRFMAAGGYGMCLYFASQPAGSTLNSPWAFTAAFCLIYFSVDLGQSAFWAYAQDAGGKYVGSVLGWGNMWGNLGAAFGPVLYNYLLGENPTAAEWNNLFWLGLIAFVFAGVATFGLDASKPVFADEPH
jgi:nitrate/nitrite transporter NarK